MGLHNFIPSFLKKNIQLYLIGPNLGPYPLEHFSLGGEDIILFQILKAYHLFKPEGFFVDVGAFHPHVESNTYGLYKFGWRGINIEARPGSKVLFDKHRPGDVNLEIGVTSVTGTLDYYFISEDSRMNSFSGQYLRERGVLQQVQKKIPVQTMPLKKVFEHNSIPREGIDYLNIDAEGLDLDIILSNDFNVVRPKIISIEVSPINNLEDVITNNVYKKLTELNYECIAKNFIIKNVGTLFFIDKSLA
ncbi:MAG: FkbM family methyltransferase [Bacteroidota bacterium]|nr:FkbM family methyltransferase [Bacteroidota bacterium]